jgi:hypothetical protein
MHDDRMGRRTALESVNARYGRWIAGIGAKAIDRFSRECDQFASAQASDRLG